MIIKTNILTTLQDRSLVYLPDSYLQITGSKISNISSVKPAEAYKDHSNAICLPGFIDLHVHLSQFNARGKHASGLLQWLNNYIFTEEHKAEDVKYAEEQATEFFKALVSCGTTTSVVYIAPSPQACDIAFQKAEEAEVRTIMGQTLMDQNCPDYLCRSTEQSLEEAVFLFNKWNQSTPLLEYIFTPRFAPVCSPELMRGIGEYALKNDAYIQTHLSENKQEIDWVRELFPDCRNYTEVYKKHGLLGEKTLLGHAIHLSDEEMQVLAATKSKITHCPDSNFFLHSGTFPLERILKQRIVFGLGSDVGAGTTLYMPHIMKMFIYRQDSYLLSPADAFYYTTLGAARVLGKEKTIGSIEVDKEADLVFIHLPENIAENSDEILSYLTYISSPDNILATYIAGKECYRKDSN